MSTVNAFVVGVAAGATACAVAVLIVIAVLKRRHRAELRLNAWVSSEMKRLGQDPDATGGDYADLVFRYGRLMKLSREGGDDAPA